MSTFHLVGSLASSLDVVVDFHCEEELCHRRLEYHQFFCSIGTSCNCEYGQHVEGFGGPGADNRPNRCASPIEHDHGQPSRNLDEALKQMV